MQSNEFCLRALPYLAQLFPEMEKRVTTEEQVARWWVRFGHLSFDVWRRSVDAYADDNHFPPTVNKLMEYVPETQRKPVKVEPERTDQTWESMPEEQREAMRLANLRQLRDVYAVINKRSWGMGEAHE